MIAPPFFVATGKRVTPAWKKSLDASKARKRPLSLQWMGDEDLITTERKIFTSKKESMTINVMPNLVKQFEEFDRRTAPIEKLTFPDLDGDSSQKKEISESCI